MSRANNKKDKSSLANPDEVKSTALTLSLNLDFIGKKLEGCVEHLMVVQKNGANKAIFDTSDITVTGAEVDGEHGAFGLLIGVPRVARPPRYLPSLCLRWIVNAIWPLPSFTHSRCRRQGQVPIPPRAQGVR
jgi:hypothetical protein